MMGRSLDERVNKMKRMKPIGALIILITIFLLGSIAIRVSAAPEEGQTKKPLDCLAPSGLPLEDSLEVHILAVRCFESRNIAIEKGDRAASLRLGQLGKLYDRLSSNSCPDLKVSETMKLEKSLLYSLAIACASKAYTSTNRDLAREYEFRRRLYLNVFENRRESEH